MNISDHLTRGKIYAALSIQDSKLSPHDVGVKGNLYIYTYSNSCMEATNIQIWVLVRRVMLPAAKLTRVI